MGSTYHPIKPEFSFTYFVFLFKVILLSELLDLAVLTEYWVSLRYARKGLNLGIILGDTGVDNLLYIVCSGLSLWNILGDP